LSRQNSKISGSQTQIAIQVFYSRIRDGPPRPVGSGEHQEKISEVAKSIHFNLPLTFAIVTLSIFISFRKTAQAS
jgi:hypothetical protein